MLKAISKKNNPFVSVVIAAAGASIRAGKDKILAEICGMPVIARTVAVFEQCDKVNEIIIVSFPDKLEKISKLCEEYNFKKVRKVVSGGETRSVSVFAGVCEADKRADIIAIHDGARPLVTQDIISSVISAAEECGGAAPFVPLKDTIKQIKDGFVVTDVERSSIAAVQTPQAFYAEVIKGALTKAVAENAKYTDDCAAVERFGGKVRVCEGNYENLKITTPEDFLFAEQIILRRDSVENRTRV